MTAPRHVHSLFVGRTLFGKSYLAKVLAKQLKAGGRKIIVYDVLRSPDWNADFITDDQTEFLEMFWTSVNCAVFVDEGAESIGKFNLDMLKTATRGRHNGHQVFYLATRAADISKSVRAQTTTVYLFSCPLSDCKDFADEFDAPELLQAARFEPGYFFKCVGGQRPIPMSLDFDTGKILQLNSVSSPKNKSQK